MAFDPDFKNNGWIYTHQNIDEKAQIRRYTIREGVLDHNSLTLVAEHPQVPDDWYHTGGGMEFSILLKREDDLTTPVVVGQIERTGSLQEGTLGLSLAESKLLLAGVQQELVHAQSQCHAETVRICAQCGTRRRLNFVE